MTPADTITGDAGTDNLSITSTGTSNTSSAVTMTGVEKLTLVDTATTKTTIDALSFTGLETISVQGSTGQSNSLIMSPTWSLSSLFQTLVPATLLTSTTQLPRRLAPTQAITTNTSAQTVEIASIETASITTAGSASPLSSQIPAARMYWRPLMYRVQPPLRLRVLARPL